MKAEKAASDQANEERYRKAAQERLAAEKAAAEATKQKDLEERAKRAAEDRLKAEKAAQDRLAAEKAAEERQRAEKAQQEAAAKAAAAKTPTNQPKGTQESSVLGLQLIFWLCLQVDQSREEFPTLFKPNNKQALLLHRLEAAVLRLS